MNYALHTGLNVVDELVKKSIQNLCGIFNFKLLAILLAKLLQGSNEVCELEFFLKMATLLEDCHSFINSEQGINVRGCHYLEEVLQAYFILCSLHFPE